MEEKPLANASFIFDGICGSKPAAPELNQDQLYFKIGQLKLELDCLKKVRDLPVAERSNGAAPHDKPALSK